MSMINSVVKALEILELFSSDGPWLTLGTISERLGFPKSTTHGLLNTLVVKGYVERSDDGRYALGTAVVPLTQAVRVNVELRDRAPCSASSTVCRESVYLTVLDHDHVLYIYAVETPQRLLARTAVGDRVSPHCTAGQGDLSQLPAEQVASLVQRTAWRATRRTPLSTHKCCRQT